jgi:hypothetical protein
VRFRGEGAEWVPLAALRAALAGPSMSCWVVIGSVFVRRFGEKGSGEKRGETGDSRGPQIRSSHGRPPGPSTDAWVRPLDLVLHAQSLIAPSVGGESCVRSGRFRPVRSRTLPQAGDSLRGVLKSSPASRALLLQPCLRVRSARGRRSCKSLRGLRGLRGCSARIRASEQRFRGTSRSVFLAERVGFEPTRRFNPPTRFPVRLAP